MNEMNPSLKDIIKFALTMMTAIGTLVTQVIFKTLPIWQLVTTTHILVGELKLCSCLTKTGTRR